ncbi:MAG: nitroreductase family protein [Bacteroidales bacterium]|nr:nitroreductase family protein [Bacteroidales bacterium]MCF8327805.1 nitroreductase family protein [Bacteroidales bacterium]
MKSILEHITQRYSPYSFQDKKVTMEDLSTLLDAARRAPSSYNEQPWRFIYATRDNEEEWNRMLDILVPQNQEWAKKASILMLSVAKKTSIVTGKPNPYSFHDTGMALGNLLNQATSMGIYVHQMGGYDRSKAIENLNIPDEYQPVAMIALGYPDKSEKREETPRNSVESFTFKGSWK